MLVKYLSITETAEKAVRQYVSTLAVMRLSELLTKSKKIAEVPVKKGTKNKKPFLKMYIMQLDNIKTALGLQISTGDNVQYCIISIRKTTTQKSGCYTFGARNWHAIATPDRKGGHPLREIPVALQKYMKFLNM